MKFKKFTLLTLLTVAAATFAESTAAIPSPPDLWSDYDPDKGEFKEEIIKRETRDGIDYRESYISAYVLGEEIRVYCKYSCKTGLTRAPGLLSVHGWMGAPSPEKKFVADGWAVMAHDYCGMTGDRPQFTKYPASLKHGNMDRNVCGPVRSTLLDGKDITDPKQTSDYIWYAIQRRVLSYLEQQPEVDPTRLGATGYSYGGTLMWHLGTDARVKAVVAYFGIGYTEYWRNKQVWMYNVPYIEPPKSPGEEIYLASIAAEAHVPFITAATLFLNGSNDHHGGHERGLESFKKFPKNVPWSFAIQARGHHDTEKIEHDTKFWLEKHVLGKDIVWPDQPKSGITLDNEGVPELIITPDSPEKVVKVEAFYALKNPCSYQRSWRDAVSVKEGGRWIAKLPVLNVDDYVFGYANITYDTTIVHSTHFEAAIPSRLGEARATDQPSDNISSSGYSAWSNIAELEGPKGIKAFRSTNGKRGSGTEQLHDPKWKAPPGASLRFKFYCTEPQTVILTGGDHHSSEIEITASDEWQEMVLPASRLINRFNQKPMEDWSDICKLHLQSKPGFDLTRVLFADFNWQATDKK